MQTWKQWVHSNGMTDEEKERNKGGSNMEMLPKIPEPPFWLLNGKPLTIIDVLIMVGIVLFMLAIA